METPTTTTEAVEALLATGNVPVAKPLGWKPGGVDLRAPGDDDLTAITRAWPKDFRLPTKARFMPGRDRIADQEGVDTRLPAALITAPAGRTIGGWIARDWTADLIEAEGWDRYPYPVGRCLATKRHRDAQRGRLVVLAGPEVPPDPSPAEAWAVTVSVLTARKAAEDLTTWAAPMRASDATAVRAEAGVYEAYADEAAALIPAVFGWLSEVPDQVPVPAFPTVPAQVRGFVQLDAT